MCWRGRAGGGSALVWLRAHGAYAWRALAHWTLTLVTLGLLWPRMTFWLEKYRTDRTYFGSALLLQEGRWQMLFPAMRHVLIGGLASVVVAGAALGLDQAALWPALAVTGPWFLFGLVHYRVRSFQILTGSKRLGDVAFAARPRPWRVLRIYVFGYGLAGLATFGLVVAVLLLTMLSLAGVAGSVDRVTDAQIDRFFQGIPGGVAALLGVLLYFAFFLLWSAMTHSFVTLPLMRHYAETLTILSPRGLDGIRQRPRDAMEQAEGFAEALDVGAAI